MRTHREYLAIRANLKKAPEELTEEEKVNMTEYLLDGYKIDQWQLEMARERIEKEQRWAKTLAARINETKATFYKFGLEFPK